MRNNMIDAPWYSSPTVYLDIKSFKVPSNARSNLFISPSWVASVISSLALEFDFKGLAEPQGILKKKMDYSEIVGEVVEANVKDWNTILTEDASVLFYLGQPSSSSIITNVDYTRMFPFTGDHRYLRNIAINRSQQASKANYVSKSRQEESKVSKFFRKWL